MTDQQASGPDLRDYFAAKAPPPPKWWMDSYKDHINTDLDSVAEHIAQWNYSYADAMLKARQK
jgi:hypothetical protein